MLTLLLAILLPQDLFGDGVIDAAGGRLFLIAPKGGIDVVDAVSGNVAKHFETNGRPLAFAEGTLVVETLEGRSATLRLLDLEGKVLFSSAPVEFPDWASTRPGTSGRKFSSRAQVEGSTLHYDWFAGAHHVSGIPPSAQQVAESRKDASGRVSIELRTHAVALGPVPPDAARRSSDRTDGRLGAGGRVYTVVAKEDIEGGRPRAVRTLTSDAGWTRLLTPRYYAIPVPSAPR